MTVKKKLTIVGYNYLLETRKKTFEKKSNNLSNDLLNNNENIDNNNYLKEQQKDYIVELLENQIVELKQRITEEQEQKKYWQDLYIKQNEEFKRLAFPPTLDTQEGNKETEQKELKKSFWQRLWRKLMLKLDLRHFYILDNILYKKIITVLQNGKI